MTVRYCRHLGCPAYLRQNFLLKWLRSGVQYSRADDDDDDDDADAVVQAGSVVGASAVVDARVVRRVWKGA